MLPCCGIVSIALIAGKQSRRPNALLSVQCSVRFKVHIGDNHGVTKCSSCFFRGSQKINFITRAIIRRAVVWEKGRGCEILHQCCDVKEFKNRISFFKFEKLSLPKVRTRVRDNVHQNSNVKRTRCHRHRTLLFCSLGNIH